MFKDTFIKLACVVLIWSTIGPPGLAVPQELLKQLVEQGIQINAQTTVAITPPTLQPDQSSPERQAALKVLTGKQSWESFARDSVHAPVMISISYIQDPDGNRIGHDIHSAFVAYAALESLRDEDLMREVFGPTSNSDASERDANDGNGSRPQTHEISPAVLEKLGIEDSVAQEQYRHIELPLLNQVRVQGTVRIEKHEGRGWVWVVWQIDPRFAESDAYGATWTKLERTPLGEGVRTEPRPYSGCGGYMSITEIDAERKQLLIESRMILHEPVDWFAGSNFLRAKLPPALQENARDFRRRLERLKIR